MLERDPRPPVSPAATIVVPTFNEEGNVPALVAGLAQAFPDGEVEVLFVDDSTDGTPAAVARVATMSPLSVRCLHRERPTGGLGGAVLEGLRAAVTDLVVVMDGDLQHPPSMVPVLVRTAQESGADLVVASRYTGAGDAAGLSNRFRRLVSSGSTAVTRAMFPSKLRTCTDPMTGFFVVRRSTVDLDGLMPSGFKILLEIIARQRRGLHIEEEPFIFGARLAGQSKANLRQGVDFLVQLVRLRFGRMSGFALIGALGALLNVALVALGVQAGLHYLLASALAAELTIGLNFALGERFVFRDLTGSAVSRRNRFARSFAFNNSETLVRLSIVAGLVSGLGWHPVPVTAVTLGLAFVARFAYHSLVVYRPAVAPNRPVHSVEQVIAPPQMAPTASSPSEADAPPRRAS
ncbi:glycosyltransferase family 2 protein [Pengzhenrongella sp.]|jgi:dolichol-phosphate mannosyltransferase|uniref:glycosyltransferase family 2 protein n=1 Tax=Pengzhenrongella sp. TaxID=2888820 RepID=UPI002F934F6B